jgi:hypothetical protein
MTTIKPVINQPYYNKPHKFDYLKRTGVYVGNSGSNTKVIDLNTYLENGKYEIYNFDGFYKVCCGDTFSATISNNKLYIRRTDYSGGWRQYLTAYINLISIDDFEHQLNSAQLNAWKKDQKYMTDLETYEEVIMNKSSELYKLNQEIQQNEQTKSDLDIDISSMNQTIKDSKNTINKKENNFNKSKEQSVKLARKLLPMKYEETSEDNNYYNALLTQNKELDINLDNKIDTYTTADREYLVNDAKTPKYISINNIFLIIYIFIASFVIYKILYGMISDNIYAKIISIIIIILYPIYIYFIEIKAYNLFLFFKAVIRGEPYVQYE